MKMNFKKVLLILLALLLLASTVLVACEDNKDADTTGTPAATAESAATEPTKPDNTDDTEEDTWTGFHASCFTGDVQDFEGTIDGETFSGILFKSNNYQPSIYFTKNAMKNLRLYARENGYDAIRIHAYAKQMNNMFVIAGHYLPLEEWTAFDLSLGDLFTFTQFWSQSEGSTENYLWFEFMKLPVINATSFTSGIYEFSGEVAGKNIDGFVFKSSDYQPYAFFNDWAIEDIKAYAAENGFNALRISVYPIQLDNAFILGGRYFNLNRWTTVDFSIEDMTVENMWMWSQSQGTTENYMTFEFVNSDNPVKPSKTVIDPNALYNTTGMFTSTGNYGTYKYNGTIDGVTFNGYRLKSTDYQPYFYLTDKGVNTVRGGAELAGANMVRIHVYPILLDNAFICGPGYCPNNTWTEVEVPIENINKTMQFWSQSQGVTDCYIWFEYFYLNVPDRIGPIDASFFERVDLPIGFSDFKGEVDGVSLNGVYVKSADYQPHFKFTAAGIEQLKKWAAENDYNILKLHSYAKLYDNGFVVGSTYCGTDVWNTTEIFIEDITEDFLFWSQSEGITEIWMWFDFAKLDVPEKDHPIDGTFFEGLNSVISSETFRGEIAGETINGVKIKSVDYQPYFKFTEDGLKAVLDYANENGYNMMRVHTYAELLDNCVVIGDNYLENQKWDEAEIAIDRLTPDFKFWSQSQGVTEIWMWFEFEYSVKFVVNPYNQPLHARSFTGGGVTFEDYQGTAGGENITGIKVTSAVYQPHFYLTQAAVDELKNSGKTTLTIHAIAYLYDNLFLIGTKDYVGPDWYTATINIADLSTTYPFWSQSQGLTEIYMWFELN